MKSFHIQAENLTFFLACVDYAKKPNYLKAKKTFTQNKAFHRKYLPPKFGRKVYFSLEIFLKNKFIIRNGRRVLIGDFLYGI